MSLPGLKMKSTKRSGAEVAAVAIAAIVGALILGLIGAVISGFLLMLALGIIAKEVAVVPALSFVASVAVLVALSVIGGALKGTSASVK